MNLPCLQLLKIRQKIKLSRFHYLAEIAKYHTNFRFHGKKHIEGKLF